MTVITCTKSGCVMISRVWFLLCPNKFLLIFVRDLCGFQKFLWIRQIKTFFKIVVISFEKRSISWLIILNLYMPGVWIILCLIVSSTEFWLFLHDTGVDIWGLSNLFEACFQIWCHRWLWLTESFDQPSCKLKPCTQFKTEQLNVRTEETDLKHPHILVVYIDATEMSSVAY